MAQTPATSPQVLSHYALKKKLGEGAMGQVWLAHDKLLDRDVAIKVLHAGASDQRLVKDFLREAQSAARLNHPNTVTIYQIGKDGNRVFIAMEYVEAGSLADELRDKGALPWREATQAIRDAAAGLQAAHEMGMVHRDIKPSNLMRSARGLVKVVDFGLAKARDGKTDVTQTQQGTILGSPAYMAPEQCRGEPADARSDLYSLICSYYQLLTRQLPFAADQATVAMYQHCHEPFPDPRDKGFKLPDSVRRILAKGSRKSPAERYQNAGELIDDLDVVLHTPEVSHTFDGKTPRQPTLAVPVGPGISIGSILKGKGVMGKTIWAVAAVMLVVLAAASLKHPRSAPNAGASNAAASGKLAPVPSLGAQFTAERTIKDVFKEDYGKGNPVERKALAEKLIDQGQQTNNDLPAKFVLFREARDLAAGAGDYDLAFRAIDAMAAVFVVDAMDLRSGALVMAAPKIETPEANTALAHACLDLVDTAVAAEQYPPTTRLLAVADSAARKAQQIALLADVQAKTKQVQELRFDLDRRKIASAALAKNPEDAEANAEMGRSLCFFKGSWDAGLPLLAKGSDATLLQLALKELSHPTDGPARLQLADAWWDFADRQGDTAKAQVQRHATDWYAKAWPDLTGLDRAKAESRMPEEMRQKLAAMPKSEPPAASPLSLGNGNSVVSPPASTGMPSIDLLPLVAIPTDSKSGTVVRTANGIDCTTGSRLVLPLPYRPPPEYDFRIDFTRVKANNSQGAQAAQLLSHAGRQFIWLNAREGKCGFEMVDRKSAEKNETTASVDLPIGIKHSSIVQVRNDHVTAYVDGKRVASYKTDPSYSHLGNAYWTFDPDGVGLGVFGGEVIFHSARVYEISGHGTVDPAIPSAPPASPVVKPPAVASHAVDVLKLIDVERDRLKGQWQSVDGALASSDLHSLMEVPYHPPAEYDFRVVFSPGNDKGHGMSLVLAKGLRMFSFTISAGSYADAFSLVNGQAMGGTQNPTKVQSRVKPALGQKYTIEVRVRNDHVEGLLDGKLVTSYKTDYSDLTNFSEFKDVQPGTLGLATWDAPATIYSAEVVEVPGSTAGNIAAPASVGATAPSMVPGHRLVDLMPLIDLNRDVVGGHWKADSSGLVSDDSEYARIRIEYEPPEEYDFRIEFTRLSGADCVAQTLAHGDHSFQWEMGGYGNQFEGFAKLNDLGANENSTAVQSHAALQNGKRYTSVVQVRRGSVAAYIDGQLVSKTDTDYSNLTLDDRWGAKRGSRRFGIGSHSSPTVFHKIELVEVTGSGKRLAGSSPVPIGSTGGPASDQPTAVAEDSGHRMIDLMPLIDTKRDRLAGEWDLQSGTLTAHGGDADRLQIPFTPPAEYEWTIVAERTEETGHGLVLGFVDGGIQSTLVMDGFHRSATGLELLDGAKGNENPTTYRQRIFPAKQSVTIVLTVRKDRVTATCDGKAFIDWQGDPGRLSVNDRWKVPNVKQLFIGAQAPFRITKMSVASLAGAPALPIERSVSAAAEKHPVVNLLPIMDPDRDPVAGKWHKVGESVAVKAAPGKWASIRLPYIPSDAEEYDFHVGYTFTNDAGELRGLASAGKNRFGLELTSDGQYGLSLVGGEVAGHNPTHGTRGALRDRGPRHDFVIRIRAKLVDACFDGKRVINHDSPSNLSEDPAFKRSDDALGLSVTGDIEFDTIEVIEVKGNGNVLRPLATPPAPAAAQPPGADSKRRNPGLVAGFTTTGDLQSAQVSPGGRRLLFCTHDIMPHAVTLVDLETGNVVHAKEASFGQFLPDGKRILTDWLGWVVGDIETGEDLLPLGDFTFGNAAVSGEGTRLLTFNANNPDNPVLYDLNSGAKIVTLSNHATHPPRALSPAGHIFAAGAGDHQLHMWNAGNGAEMWHVPDDDRTKQLTFSKEGTRLLRRSDRRDAPLDLFSSDTGELLAQCGAGNGRCNDAAMSESGAYLLAAFDHSPGLNLFALKGDPHALTANPVDGWPEGFKQLGPVNAVAFSPGDHRVLAGCSDGKLRVYDLETGSKIAEFDHGGDILLASFSSDGRYAVSGNDTSVRVWRLP